MSASHRQSNWSTIAATAQVHPSADVGEGSSVWDLTQIRENAKIGSDTVIGRNVYIDHDVVIGAACKIQNNALLYWPAVIGDGVFIGPGVILTNDRNPRAVNVDGTAKGSEDWAPTGVHIESGASIGAGAVILGGVQVGAWALVGASAVVTRDVTAHALVVGSPAARIGWVGKTGHRLAAYGDLLIDPVDGTRYRPEGEALVVVG
ncbi:MAG: N-acetyltransferase [Actinomycetota bacterium]|nr:N-acetyltransferase [Actinomycetota bacterium]